MNFIIIIDYCEYYNIHYNYNIITLLLSLIIIDSYWLLMIIDYYWWLLMIIDYCWWSLMIVDDYYSFICSKPSCPQRGGESEGYWHLVVARNRPEKPSAWGRLWWLGKRYDFRVSPRNLHCQIIKLNSDYNWNICIHICT